MTIFLLILGLIFFIGLVVAHEFGHYIMARRNGVDVEEFGIGFPPRAKLLTTKKGTQYTLNWLPLGGFVKLKGEHDSDTTKGSFGAASIGAKIKIMLAGVVVNLGLAILLLTILAATGLPVLINKDNQNEDQFTVASDEHIASKQVLINYVEKNSPAERAGLKPLDLVESIGTVTNQEPITDYQQLREKTKSFAGKTAVLHYQREGKHQQATIHLRTATEVAASLKTSEPKGYVGIALANYQVNRYTWSAPVVAVGLTGQLTKLTFKGLGTAVKGLGGLIAGLATQNTAARQHGQTKATEQVSGPLGIYFLLQAGAHQGIGMIIFIIAIISLTLAIMNVLPIPALDGGRLFVTLLYRAARRPLTQRAEELIHGSGFALLMVLFLLITIVDVKRFI